MSDYYVYALLDPRKPQESNNCGFSFTHLPKYIGKGRGHRARNSALYDATFTNSPKARWVRRLRTQGLEPILVFVQRDMKEVESFELERQLIKSLGRKKLTTGPLLNQSNGGEGGKHFTEEQRREYVAKLKARGSELRLIGGAFGYQSYASHKCKLHGIVETAPVHVLKRLDKGLPLCPKCGIEKRGPQMRKHRLATGSENYRQLLSMFKPKYRMIGDYTGATVLTEHSCKKHGSFMITPANVRQKVTLNLTPCPTCNKINWKPGDNGGARKRRAAEEYAQLLQDTYGSSFTALDEYAGVQKSIRHNCVNHGEVRTLPREVKNRAKRGIPGCPECGRERVRLITIERNQKRG